MGRELFLAEFSHSLTKKFMLCTEAEVHVISPIRQSQAINIEAFGPRQVPVFAEVALRGYS
jgi:hypothetical protein